MIARGVRPRIVGEIATVTPAAPTAPATAAKAAAKPAQVPPKPGAVAA